MSFGPTILYLKMYPEEYLEMYTEIHTQRVKNWKRIKCPNQRMFQQSNSFNELNLQIIMGKNVKLKKKKQFTKYYM